MANINHVFFPDATFEAGFAASPNRDGTHLEVTVQTIFKNEKVVNKVVKRMGSGEVAAINAEEVRRIYPVSEVMDAESNYFPLIEFRSPFFPWQFPHIPKDKDLSRFLPWIVLITLAEDEFTLVPKEDVTTEASPYIIVNVGLLPNLKQSWAWAHVQVDTPKDTSDHKSIILEKPDKAYSRLLSPRYLKKETIYHCFLVPSFERGRLKLMADPAYENTPAETPAWQFAIGDQGEIKLPFYHTWRFKTGKGGDFEQLVKKLLPPVSLPKTIGYREMNVGDLGLGLPLTTAKSPPTFYLPGALISFDAKEDLARKDLEATLTKDFEDSFISLLNQSSLMASFDEEDEDKLPVLGPPLYGQWHAGKKMVDARMGGWFKQLNLELVLRAAAGLGTEVIIKHQEKFMEAAWDQYPDIKAFNHQQRQQQLALELGKCLYKKHIEPLSANNLLPISDRFHHFLAAKDQLATTIYQEIDASRIPNAVISDHFRKLIRKSGPLKHYKYKSTRLVEKQILGHLHAGQIMLTPKLEKADQDITPVKDLENLVATQAALIESLPEASLKAIETLTAQVRDQLNPLATIVPSVKQRLELADGFSKADRNDNEPYFERVMAAPEFPHPMYKYLVELSPDWLLPRIDQVPHNSISLVSTNQKFIEAFMVGLNHEMARELVWREYPTDQRGTYFRQFWDAIRYDDDPESGLTDINPIIDWGHADLGDNRTMAFKNDDSIVLLIRGELLYRYPNAIIYAQKASRKSGNGSDGPSRVLGEEKKYPIFQGFIPPDITFLGFNFGTPDDRAEVSGANDELGWFFVIKENPSEPRFGLDLNESDIGTPVTDLNDFSWHHLIQADSNLSNITYIDLASDIPEITDRRHPWSEMAGATSADIAWITYQNPFSIAIHGAKMLPPNP